MITTAPDKVSNRFAELQKTRLVLNDLQVGRVHGEEQVPGLGSQMDQTVGAKNTSR